MEEVTEYIKTEKTALRLIARAEQNCAGLSRKLEKRGFNTGIINEVISKLTEMNLLNDSRYARFWLGSRIRLAKSPRRLLSSLCAKGIDHDIAQAALNQTLDAQTENALLEKLAKKSLKKLMRKRASENDDIKRALKSLLRNEGFSSQAIQIYLESIY